MNKTISLLLICFSCQLIGQLNMMETADMRMVSYDFGHSYILPHAAKCFHNSLDFHRRLFDYEPSEKVTVLIQDFGDYGNAGATGIPKNFVTMGLSPFSYAFETSPAGERVYSMMNHELVHVAALDNATSADKFYHKLFMGKVEPTKEHPISMFYSFLTSPRRYSPRWYHEGIAAYVETWMNGGIGLALGSFDEMVFRTRVLEGARIYSAQGLESEGVTTDFQGRSNSYLYGTRFMGYLAYIYGPDKIIEWVKRTDGSKRFFVGQFKKVFGFPISKGWDDWIAFERKWQSENAERIKEFPITETVPVTSRTLGSVSYGHYDSRRNKIYVAVNYPGTVPHLAAINLGNGTIKRLTDIKGPALFYVSSVTYDEQNDMIYFTSDNDTWRDLNRYHIASGKTELLQRDFRTGDLAFNKTDQSIWGIKHLNGISTIVKIPRKDPAASPSKEYSSWKQMFTLEYGQDIFDIDISPDGSLLSAAVSDLKGNQSLLLYNMMKLNEGEVKVDTIFNFDISSPQSFRFTKDGKYLFGSSYYTGVSNIYRIEIKRPNPPTDQTSEKLFEYEIKAFSNALTGLFRPLQIDDSKLFAFQFCSNGFQPVFIENKPAEGVNAIEFLGNEAMAAHEATLKEWELPVSSSANYDLEALNVEESTYKPGKLISANYAYPVIVGYKNNFGLGYRFNFSDPLKFRELDFVLSYTPKSWSNGLANESDTINLQLDNEEQYHFSFNGSSGRFSFHASYNESDFYDLFGPTKNSRKGISMGVDFDHSLIWDRPITLDWNIGLGGFYGLEKSPEFQQISIEGFDESFFFNFHSSVTYSYLKYSLGAVDSEKGVKTSLSGSVASSEGEYFPNLIATFDYGFQLPIKHFSIWWRSSAGTSFRDAFNPFTRFGFAAFGNNYVDYQFSRRYRSSFSFPGLSYTDDKAIIAKDFAKTMVEFVLPPIRFRNFGGFNFYANWIQPSFFSSILVTRDPSTVSNKFVNVGAQLDTRLVMFSLLSSTLSVGYARAWDLNSDLSYNEWMISLKLLK